MVISQLSLSQRFRLTLAFTCIILNSVATKPVYGASKSVRGWEIEQEIRQWGKQEILLSGGGMRLHDVSRGVTIVMSAPHWKPVLYSDTRKVIAETTLRNVQLGFSGRFRMMVSGTSSAKAKNWKPSGNTRICNRKALVLKMVPDESAPHEQWVFWKYWVCQDIPVPSQITSLITAHYGIADLGKVPLRYQTGTNKARVVMNTLSIDEKSIDQKMFSAPANYKKVTPDQVMFAVMEF